MSIALTHKISTFVQILSKVRMSFFSKPSHKKFELKTRYYDEEQEKLEQRKRRWERLANPDDEPGYDREGFKNELKEKWEQERGRKKGFFAGKFTGSKPYSDNKRLLILAILVAMILFIIYKIGKNYGV